MSLDKSQCDRQHLRNMTNVNANKIRCEQTLTKLHQATIHGMKAPQLLHVTKSPLRL